MTTEVPPERAEESINQYRASLSALRETRGNRGALLLLHRESGRGIGVTLWEDKFALRESREEAHRLRQQLPLRAEIHVGSVDEYEVAVWEPT